MQMSRPHLMYGTFNLVLGIGLAVKREAYSAKTPYKIKKKSHYPYKKIEQRLYKKS